MKQTYRQQGFAAVAAIFLVVVLAALGSYMVAFSNTQQLTSALDTQGTRGYWAARAGIEWVIGNVGESGSPPACPTSPTTLNGGFDGGFTVDVTCVRVDYTESGSTRYMFSFRSVATAGTSGSPGFAERSISASMER